MSKIHDEEKEILGTLYTEFGTFQMLQLEPNKYGVPFLLQQQGFISFYVVGSDDFGKNIIVNSHHLLIEPVSEISTKVVHFLLADEPQKV